MTESAFTRGGFLEGLCRRLAGRDFIVERRMGGVTQFVQSIAVANGHIDWTTDASSSRLFRGEQWVRFWCRPGYVLVLSAQGD